MTALAGLLLPPSILHSVGVARFLIGFHRPGQGWTGLLGQVGRSGLLALAIAGLALAGATAWLLLRRRASSLLAARCFLATGALSAMLAVYPAAAAAIFVLRVRTGLGHGKSLDLVSWLLGPPIVLGQVALVTLFVRATAVAIGTGRGPCVAGPDRVATAFLVTSAFALVLAAGVAAFGALTRP